MSLFESASLCITPNGTKASKLYAIKPTDGSGDLSVTRATTATRVNSSGLISSVASNVPRLDYTNGSCPSILVEPQRTNLALYSEQFDNVTWLKGQSTVTANTIISPDGNTNADILFELATTSTHNVASSNLISFVSGTSYTISIYAKNNTSGRGLLQIAGYALGSGASNIYANFNLSNGTLGSVSGGTSTITAAANGFYRLTFSFTCGNTISERLNYSLITSSTSTAFQSYLGDSSKGIIIYGAQLEEGSYATSYIPTTSASVTRNADVISKTGISSLIGQTEGTIFLNCKINTNNENADIFLLYNNSNVTLGAYVIGFNTSGNITLYSLPSGSLNTLKDGDNRNINIKIALAYKSGDFSFYINGIETFTSSSISIANGLSALFLNSNNLPANFGIGNYNTVSLFPTRLTNAELTELTTI